MESAAVAVTAHILASTDRVWELVSDIGLMPRFSDELRSVEWIDGSRPRVGASFAGTNIHPMMGTWTTYSVIIEGQPPRVFAWAVGDPDVPAATWRFDLTAVDAATSVRYAATIGPGRSGVSMLVDRYPHRRDEIVADRLSQFERGMASTLAGIKTLAES